MHVIDLKLPESFRERRNEKQGQTICFFMNLSHLSQLSQQEAKLNSEAQLLPFPIQISYCKAMRYKEKRLAQK